jgi:hypothetical protein
MEAHIHIAFCYPAKFRLSSVVSKGGSANAPTYNLNLLPPHPTKGEKQIAHKCGSLWLKVDKNGANYMSGYVETPIFAGGRLPIVVFKPPQPEGDYLYEIFLMERNDERGN